MMLVPHCRHCFRQHLKLCMLYGRVWLGTVALCTEHCRLCLSLSWTSTAVAPACVCASPQSANSAHARAHICTRAAGPGSGTHAIGAAWPGCGKANPERSRSRGSAPVLASPRQTVRQAAHQCIPRQYNSHAAIRTSIENYKTAGTMDADEHNHPDKLTACARGKLANH